MNVFGTQHILKQDGCPIHYWLTGPEDGPVLLFTHTGFADHTMFESQIAILAQHYRILTWDMRGHGLSQPLRGTLSYRGTVEDIIALLDQLAVESAVLVGASMGGCAAQEVVFRCPERVAALVLIGCPCVTTICPKSVAFFSRIFLGIAHLLPEKFLKQYMASSVNISIPSTVPEVQAYIRETTKLISKPTIIAMFRAVLTGFHDEPDYRITHPLLLVHGDHDSSPIQAQAPIWAKRDPNCRYEVIPEAGHNANQDNPLVFNNLLQDFLHEYTRII
jgi:pimeloyl-ACP methyl ester carboxylesterase